MTGQLKGSTVTIGKFLLAMEVPSVVCLGGECFYTPKAVRRVAYRISYGSHLFLSQLSGIVKETPAFKVHFFDKKIYVVRLR